MGRLGHAGQLDGLRLAVAEPCQEARHSATVAQACGETPGRPGGEAVVVEIEMGAGLLRRLLGEAAEAIGGAGGQGERAGCSSSVPPLSQRAGLKALRSTVAAPSTIPNHGLGDQAQQALQRLKAHLQPLLQSCQPLINLRRCQGLGARGLATGRHRPGSLATGLLNHGPGGLLQCLADGEPSSAGGNADFASTTALATGERWPGQTRRLRPLPWALTVPLRVHSRYSRTEIETAFGILTDTSPGIHREGVLWHEPTQIALLFMTLNKSEALFSPSTRDLDLGSSLLHWESQSVTTASSSTGQR